MTTDRLKEILTRARAEVGKIIIGQEAVIDRALICIFTGSHALVEGVPGVAKTLLVRTLARVLGGEFNRIQFTPDLMPTDITGTHVFNLRSNEFTLVKGPVFTTFLLADEINRAPAKTQSALLQAMQERRVTIDRDTHELSPFFTVFATQNPVEYEGTYPLPEAQKDRFMFKIEMSVPDRESELELARRMLGSDSPENALASGVVQPVISAEDLADLRRELEAVTVREELTSYVVDVVRATRTIETILVGAGPRATQNLLLASRAHAALAGRDFVTPDDVRELAEPVLGHRLVLRPEHELEGVTVREVISKILEQVPVPR
jgi:MoxR-like ATPase